MVAAVRVYGVHELHVLDVTEWVQYRRAEPGPRRVVPVRGVGESLLPVQVSLVPSSLFST